MAQRRKGGRLTREHDIQDGGVAHEIKRTQEIKLTQKCIAEFIGTAFLVFVGCGALTASGYLGHITGFATVAELLAVALAFGLAIAVMVYAIGPISKCHINPAVSIAMACTGHMSWRDAGAYIVAQLLGALAGALLIALAFGAFFASTIGYGATDFTASLTSYLGAVILEAIGTFFLLFVIMATLVDKRASLAWAGFAIGLTVTSGMLVLGAVTGGNFNPARAFGPTIVQLLFGGAYPFSHMFVYFIGPILGAIAGAFAYEYLAHPYTARGPSLRGLETGD